ncbi:HpaII family restriction endonuclease [Pleurocapsa sp. FMAR1]|uniref:HpaII family restriction endonuclease n=1 Tax=Pleurocapsa sp. FMAR1 TaxID=3040204 RepID=UPI0029C90542|nr:HpaII family restriction endonuclease [Pleurocapsa sp. FMAR1]
MEQKRFTFIDLFAGIGGFHLAMHELGGKCIFASEIDSYARKTYIHNFKNISPQLFQEDLFNSDIRHIVADEIPDFDLLCAGFPCQPFSQAGYKRGFNDFHNSERGNLFFNIADIIKVKRPKAFFLENVRGLVNHDQGKTFKVIREILELDLDYSFYYQVVKASDYGLPQLRPRIFMVGFRDENFFKGFNFPEKLPLRFNMSDVWGGVCSREIGFTLRVGGRGSNINDRRNWDSYLVNGEVRQLTYIQAKKMQGFPDNFEFPVSPTQAIKQLGNSVAVNAVKAVGRNIIAYMNTLDSKKITMKKTKNKGEWSELLTFVKILAEQQILLSDENLNPTGDYFRVTKVTGQNINLEFLLKNKNQIEVLNKDNNTIKIVEINELINSNTIKSLVAKIKAGKGTFIIGDFQVIQDILGLTIVKGGTSFQKADIILNIQNNILAKENEGFGIKSYLGSKPTLLNASGNTNFIFEIKNLAKDKVDEINAIDTRTKLTDRIKLIEQYGGIFKYVAPEKKTMEYNLKMVDSLMPEIIGSILLTFYKHRKNSISDIIDYIHNNTDLIEQIKYEDKIFLVSKVKKLLVDVLLGFFAGSKWDGTYEANGIIVVKQSGDQVAFHIIDIESLKSYLFNNIKLDTPSTTRHRYGKIIMESNNKLYFKLNLQLRF